MCVSGFLSDSLKGFYDASFQSNGKHMNLILIVYKGQICLCIKSMVIKSCLHWSGHPVHTEVASFPKRFLFSGKRNPSKPLLKYKNCLKSYLVKGKIDAEDWKLVAKDKSLGAAPFTWEPKISKMNVCNMPFFKRSDCM